MAPLARAPPANARGRSAGPRIRIESRGEPSKKSIFTRAAPSRPSRGPRDVVGDAWRAREGTARSHLASWDGAWRTRRTQTRALPQRCARPWRPRGRRAFCSVAPVSTRAFRCPITMATGAFDAPSRVACMVRRAFACRRCPPPFGRAHCRGQRVREMGYMSNHVSACPVGSGAVHVPLTLSAARARNCIKRKYFATHEPRFIIFCYLLTQPGRSFREGDPWPRSLERYPRYPVLYPVFHNDLF